MKYQPQFTKESSQGFTLLELLVVIVMIAVLAAIAAPSWLAFLNNQRIGAVRSDLVSTLSNLQEDSQQRRIYQTVWLDLDSVIPAIYYGSDNADDPTTLTRQALGPDSLPTDNKLIQLRAFYEDADGNWAEITYDPDGGDTTAMTGPCDAENKACFQFNYMGMPTNPSLEILPDNAQPYDDLDTAKVPLKIEIATVNNPEGSNKQCVIVSSLLGSIKSERGDVCDDAPPSSWDAE